MGNFTNLYFSAYASTEVTITYPEAVAGGVLKEKMFLEISQNSQENNWAGVPSLIKLQALGVQVF